MTAADGRHPRWAYPVVVGIPLAGLAAVLAYGSSLVAPSAPATAAPVAPVINPTLRVPIFLAQILVVLVVSRAAGAAMRRIGQPQVIGEMIGGLALGPSILGAVSPGAYNALFPQGTVRFLNALSQVGLLLFMFLVGTELHLESLKTKGGVALLTSHASIVMPMLFGALLAIPLYTSLAVQGVPFASFALFIGTAMSITALPVLARILAERRMIDSDLGVLALACAAVDDATAWMVLAAVVTLTNPGSSFNSVMLAALAVITFVLAMLTLGRRLATALVRRILADGQLGHDGFAALLAIVIVSSWISDRLGAHAVFGAFLAGVIMPRDPELMRQLRARLEDLLVVLLLPIFFVATGIRVRLDLTMQTFGFLLLAVIAATVGKMGGSAAAARIGGSSWREALALGSLMNARGLVGLVVVNVGLESGVISPAVYSILILTAVITTTTTAPLLDLVRRTGGGQPHEVPSVVS